MPTDLFIRIVLVMGIIWSIIEIVIIIDRMTDVSDETGLD